MSLKEKDKQILFQKIEIKKTKDEFLLSRQRRDNENIVKLQGAATEATEEEKLKKDIDVALEKAKKALSGAKKILDYLNKNKSYKIEESEEDLKKALKEEFNYEGDLINWDIYVKALTSKKNYLEEIKNETNLSVLG